MDPQAQLGQFRQAMLHVHEVFADQRGAEQHGLQRAKTRKGDGVLRRQIQRVGNAPGIRRREAQVGRHPAHLHAVSAPCLLGQRRQAVATPMHQAAEFMAEARRLLEPYNLCNLCDVGRRNMYPCVDSLHS